MAALLRPSGAVMLLGVLVAAAALVGVGTAQPSLPQRTHTFNSYYTVPQVKDLVPVFVTTDKVLQGTYAQDKIVNITDGVELDCGGNLGDGLNKCTLTETWYKRRGTTTYTSLPQTCNSFAMKNESSNLVLMVSPQCLGTIIYNDFGENPPNRQLAWGSRGGGRNYAAKGAAKAAKDNIMDPDMGLYYDPWAPDGVTPYWPGMTADDIRREKKQAEKTRRRIARLHRLEQKAWARYERWVRRQTKTPKGQPLNLTPEQYDYYYGNPDPVKNKHYPWRFVYDHSGVYRPPSPPGVGGMSVQSAEDDAFQALNQVDTSFIFDYALIFSTPNGAIRIDMTIVPKVYRAETSAQHRDSGFLCRPDGKEMPFDFSSAVRRYIPHQCSCSTSTSRAAPYANISSSYATAHSEEAAWLDGRLNVIGPKVQSFVNKKINKVLTDSQAKLKIAVVHSGGGKRAMLHSLGVVQALADLGVFEHASWNAGASGGAWYVLAHTLQSLDNNTGMNSAKSVFDNIKDRIKSSLYGDFFEANEVFTNAGVFNAVTGTLGTPLVWPSHIGLSNQTNQILCESELKLQSPLVRTGRSASPLDYWARAITAQNVPQNLIPNGGLDITMSSLKDYALLQSHAGPLPMFQIHEYIGDEGAYNGTDFRLWTVSPYDFSVIKDDKHASFPTQILGSDSTSTGMGCTVNLDNAGYLQGISSWAMGAFRGFVNKKFDVPILSYLGVQVDLGQAFNKFVQAVCGENIDATACQGTALHNPFKGFSGIESIAPELKTKNDIFVSDGGTIVNMPVWPFLTPAREADIIFAVDAGGQTGNANTGTFSTDTTDPGATPSATCSIDNIFLGVDPPAKDCEISGQPNADTSFYWTNSKGSCCDMCSSLYAQALGCLSDNVIKNSNLVSSIANYQDKVSGSKAPTMPQSDSILGDDTLAMGQRVLIFGCNEVRTKTPIVNIPNRIITSGHSGHYTLKGAINMRYSPFNINNAEQQYTDAAINAFWDNAKSSLPNKGAPFAKCVACLYYARATGNNDYMRTTTDADCQGCYRDYCYKG